MFSHICAAKLQPIEHIFKENLLNLIDVIAELCAFSLLN